MDVANGDHRDQTMSQREGSNTTRLGSVTTVTRKGPRRAVQFLRP